MPAKCFCDTNVLIYALTQDDEEKGAIARRVLIEETPLVSAQVVIEATNVLARKIGSPAPVAARLLRPYCDTRLVQPSPELIETGWRVMDRFGLGTWDAMIVAAALHGGCRVLYTEDLQDGQTVEGVKIVNPFR